MAEMIRKIFTTQVKAVEGKDRVLEFVGTTEDVDRDGEVIKASAWQVDKYTANPVVQWAHDYGAPPIGKTLSIRQAAKKTIFEIEFAAKEVYEFADTIFKLCKGGFLNATSVGFIPVEFDKAKKEGDPSRTFTKVELLEISIVPVPSNPQALVTAREAGLITVKEFNAVTKPEETEDYFRVPVKGEGGDKHSGHRIRTIDISAKDGIKALYCGECKVVITYLFDKKHDWTMAKAEAWVKEHAKSFNLASLLEDIATAEIVDLTEHGEKPVSQAQIKDELDYVISLVKAGDLNAENKALVKVLGESISALQGATDPVDIKSTPSIRSMVRPVLKALNSHDKAHVECFKACKDALAAMCEQPEDEAENAKSLREVMNEEIKRQMEVK